jgi:ribosome-associated heat shock protein Hsp15
MTGVRIDKWLWAARFFKTRSLAAHACDLGRIQANRQTVKAAHPLRVGEMLQIRTESGDFEVEILELSEVRGPASVARTLYRETEASQESRRKAAAERRTLMRFTPAPSARPSKRDRRKINQFRGKA